MEEALALVAMQSASIREELTSHEEEGGRTAADARNKTSRAAAAQGEQVQVRTVVAVTAAAVTRPPVQQYGVLVMGSWRHLSVTSSPGGAGCDQGPLGSSMVLLD